MEFQAFDKIPRLKRTIVVTEKIDGTNACIAIGDDGEFATQSRSRIIVPGDDNYGFAAWAYANKEDLLKLGPGYHYGEWWGAGIQRRYGLTEKKFSLFNTGRWSSNPDKPSCCGVVPILEMGDLSCVDSAVQQLRDKGSVAAPGFMFPEGVVIYHTSSRSMFKVTLEKDDEAKGQREAA